MILNRWNGGMGAWNLSFSDQFCFVGGFCLARQWFTTMLDVSSTGLSARSFVRLQIIFSSEEQM